jgi:NAD(P)-dependent dehydrogenase (short-subunit alcohol dehydrogenase family)
VLHWNAYAGVTGDLLTVDPAATMAGFQVGVVGLLAAVQAALPDLKAASDGAVLVTNGAFGEVSPMTDAFAVHMQATGVALANAAKHKLVGMLSERLKGDGVYVGEVMVAGVVKGTAWDNAAPTPGAIEPAAVANLFWDLCQTRGEIRARIS